MANVKFSKKRFENEIGKLDETLKEKISMFGTPLESVNEKEVEIEIFPNRPDLLSFEGFKRSFLCFIGIKKGIKEYKINLQKKEYQVLIDDSVKKVRPFTACCIIKNLKLDEEKILEIIEMQEKLHSTIGRNRKKIAIGIYPLEKITLPIKFEARIPEKINFVPLDSEKEMNGKQILEQHPKGKEYAFLLEKTEKFPVFIDAKGEILSMPPIINSQKTGRITENTKEVFVECSGFDFKVLSKTLNILSTCLADIGGEIYPMNLIYGSKIIKTPDLSSEKMKFNSNKINKILGLNLTDKEIKNCFEKMGLGCEKENAEIPAWRNDIIHEIDLAEEVAIAYGYEKFQPEILNICTTGESSIEEVLKKKFSEILCGLGITEISTYHLNSLNMINKSNIKKPELILENSKTEYLFLRSSLIPSCLKVLSENTDKEYPQKIFEIGKTFDLENKKINEKEKLVVALCGSDINFTSIKQALDYFTKTIDKKIKFLSPKQEKQPKCFISGRIAEIFFQNKKIGLIGEIHPSTLKNNRIKMPVSVLEIEIQDIIESSKE